MSGFHLAFHLDTPPPSFDCVPQKPRNGVYPELVEGLRMWSKRTIKIRPVDEDPRAPDYILSAVEGRVWGLGLTPKSN